MFEQILDPFLLGAANAEKRVTGVIRFLEELGLGETPVVKQLTEAQETLNSLLALTVPSVLLQQGIVSKAFCQLEKKHPDRSQAVAMLGVALARAKITTQQDLDRTIANGIRIPGMGPALRSLAEELLGLTTPDV